MNVMKTFFTFIVLMSSLGGFAQNMGDGFEMLEQGNNEEAVSFFEDVLIEFPSNKTAQLCYARAVGLSGDPAKAKSLFEDMLAEYSTDFEIKLNYAESLLWNQEYRAAVSYYMNLVKEQPLNFTALLGLANSHFNVKEFDEALRYVGKALEVTPNQSNALISQKYMRLGKASQLISELQFSPAMELLDLILASFPNDADAQNTKINAYLIQNDLESAENGYLQLKDSISSLTGLALIEHKRFNDKKALEFARLAKEKIKNETKAAKKEIALERFVQALIWNGNYNEAEKQLQLLDVVYPNQDFVTRLQATFGMYTGQLKKSLSAYQVLLAKDSTSFDGNLGIANAYRAKGDLTSALLFARKTLTHYPNQKDALQLIATIENSLSPTVETVLSYTKDNGENEALSVQAHAMLPWSERFSTTFHYGYRTTENKISKEMAYNTNASFGANYRIVNNTWIHGKIGFLKANTPTNDYSDVNGSVFIKSRPLPLQYLAIGVKRELQNFNAALIEEKIFMNSLEVNYNMGTRFGLGWYTSYMFTNQTDDNQRNLLFTSLYYNFTKRPLFKAGLNYQYLGFKDQMPELYFSPSKYQAAELFASLEGTSKKWDYAADVAGGFQFVENREGTTLFRINGKVNYAISPRFQIGVYGKYSTIASETATGFEFTEVGFKLRWQVTKKPLFRIKSK